MPLTYNNYIKPLMEATAAIEKKCGREEAYKFAIESIEAEQRRIKLCNIFKCGLPYVFAKPKLTKQKDLLTKESK